MVPKEGVGYPERTKSLGTSKLREARKWFPQACASLQEDHKLIEPSPSQLWQKVQMAIDELPLNSDLDLEYFVCQITGKSVIDDPETGMAIALDPQQEVLIEAIYKKDPLLVLPHGRNS